MKMNCQPCIGLDISEGLATVSLNREDQGNALDLSMVKDFHAILKEILTNKAIRVILIKSTNKDFCVGGDLHFIFDDPGLSNSKMSAMVTVWHDCLSMLTQSPQLVVVEGQGAVAGGGIGLVLVADYVVIADNTHFTAGFSKLGLNADSGLSWLLPRQIGLKRTKQFLLAEKTLDAPVALEWGIADEIVALESLPLRSKQLCNDFLKTSPAAILSIKKLLNISFNQSFTEQLDLECQGMVALAESEDVSNRAQAFIKSRK
ncbi:crotonase [Alteromonas sp. I4]|nr:crotonase [Alteromonas sp. I4]